MRALLVAVVLALVASHEHLDRPIDLGLVDRGIDGGGRSIGVVLYAHLAGARDQELDQVARRRQRLGQRIRSRYASLCGIFLGGHSEKDPTSGARSPLFAGVAAAPRNKGEGWKLHPIKRAALYLRHDFTCVCCGYKDPLKLGANLTIEHITPRSQGGAVQGGLHEPATNLTVLCNGCNATKGKKTAAQFNKTLECAGKSSLDYVKIRADSRKSLDLKAGADLAKKAYDYRKANGIKPGHWKAPEDKGGGEKSGSDKTPGPGIHHDPNNGQFTMRLAVLHMTGSPGQAMAAETRPDLDALGLELQTELRLLDWRVVYVYVPDLTDANGNAVYGLCDRLVDNKTATIAIRDPAASKPLPAGAESKPVESILMHELVHLHVAPLAVNTPQGIVAEEQAVWPLADALTRWRGTARATYAARAMKAGAVQVISAKETRKMGANAKALAMLKAAMEADGTKEDSAASKCLAALMADDEKPEPKGEPDGDEAKKAVAARAMAEEEERKKREAAAATRPAAVAAMTVETVDQRAAAVATRIVGEHAERSALIAANVPHFNAAEQSLLSTQPLATVKSLVAARLTGATTQGTEQRAARAGVGPIGPVPSDPMASVPAQDKADTEVALRRMGKLMGLEQEQRKAIEITEGGRSMALSHVGSFREQWAKTFAAEQAQARAGKVG